MEQTDQEEFQKPYGPDDLCDSNPEFAVICSFINNFGDKIDLELDIEGLKQSIENQEILDDNLIDIHVKLLKKLRRYFVRDHWQKALIRFAYEYSYEDAHEIQALGYLKSRPSIKLRLLRRLLDLQFECDAKFKSAVNLQEATELRNQATGRDIKGNTYWHCKDNFGNLRVYREEPLNYKTWDNVCKNTDDLKQLLIDLDAIKDQKFKGEPQSEPYNPYPEIFSELYDEEEPSKQVIDSKATVTNSETHNSNSKRGRSRGRTKKSIPLSTITEKIEVSTTYNDIQNDKDPIIEHHTKNQTKDNCLECSSPNSSIESHVKSTIDTILNKVASSFDFIFRRNSPDLLKNDEIKLEISQQKPTKQRKRAPLRDKPKSEQLPRRSSSRIQLLQQKKELEEKTKRQLLEVKKELAANAHDNGSKEHTTSNGQEKQPKRDKKDRQRWRSNKGRKKLSWDKDDSDLSSTSSLSESNDGSFMEAIDEAIGQDVDNEEDEFACEDEETNDEPVIIKRARTARQTIELEESGTLNNSSIVEEDKPCGRCDKSNDPDWILLCDMCDDGYHTTCCIPSLMYVPDGDWFCPSCEHKTLITKLQEVLDSTVELLAVIERERVKKQKQRQTKKITAKLDVDEILPEKRSRDILHLLNEPIAVQALDEESDLSSSHELSPTYRERTYKRPVKKIKRHKKNKGSKRRRAYEDEDYESDQWSRGTYNNRDMSESETEEEEFTESSDDPLGDDAKIKPRKARACVSYKFLEYDELIQSAICADSDAEVHRRNEEDSESETCNFGRGKDMATIEALAYQEENGITAGESAPNQAMSIPQAKQRRKGRKLNDLDAESEIDIATSDESFQASSATEDEDDEEDEVTDISTEDDSSIDEIVAINRSRSRRKKKRQKRYSSDSEDSDFQPRACRRAAAKQVSYKESTDDDEEILNPSINLKKVLSSDEETKTAPPTRHPPFYEDDEVRTPEDMINNKQSVNDSG